VFKVKICTVIQVNLRKELNQVSKFTKFRDTYLHACMHALTLAHFHTLKLFYFMQ